MTLWLILTIMISFAAVMLSAPFIRRLDRPRADLAGDVEVYRDQLKEIESELLQGMIDATQAETARVEIKRRALAADRMEQPAMPKLSAGERNFAVMSVTAIVVLGSVGLYAVTGSPDLPSVGGTGTGRQSSSAFAPESSTLESFGTAQTSVSGNQTQSRPQTGLPSVEEMIRRLAARLLQNPEDAEGWRTLGWSYSSIGRFSEASEAYAKAIELSPDVAEIRSARIEALVRSANGIVTSDAKKAIEETLQLDTKNIGARFFKGVAKEQEGDRISALNDLTALLKDANSDETWASEVKSKIAELQHNMDAGTAAASTEPKPAMAGGLLETLKTPGGSWTYRPAETGSSQDGAQTADAAPADHSAMIRGMVDGLAKRLEQSPHDADGWIKLIRSRMVLGETELAKQALARGLEIFTGDKIQQDRIVAFAQQAGLNP